METLIEGSMKFVINGRTYDTATSTAAAVHRGAREEHGMSVRYEHTLYRTQKGAFFVHEHETAKGERGKPVVTDRADAYTPETALLWIDTMRAMVLDQTGLQLPDEA